MPPPFFGERAGCSRRIALERSLRRRFTVQTLMQAA
jgi:hypothetical protein